MKNPALLTLWIVGLACLVTGAILAFTGIPDDGLFAEPSYTQLWVGVGFAAMGALWVMSAIVVMGVQDAIHLRYEQSPQPPG